MSRLFSWVWSALLLWAGVIAVGILVGCGTINKAGAPSADPMVPGPVLEFPKTLVIDVSTIRTETESTSLSKALVQGEETSTKEHAERLGAGGQFSFLVDMGGDFAAIVSEILEGILSEKGLLGSVEIESSVDIKTFSGKLAEGLDEFSGAAIDIDFADFTFEGKSATCSGNTAETPVCFRVWVERNRLVAGYFMTLPTEGNAGEGKMWINAAPFMKEVETGFAMGVRWDHTEKGVDDRGVRVTELFVNGSPEKGVSIDTGHILVQQTGETESGETKLVKMAMGFGAGQENGLDSMIYIGQWIEGKSFFSGTIDIKPLPEGFTEALTAQCVLLSTGNGTNRPLCEGAGIDVGEIKPVERAVEADYTFPSTTVFPEAPTF